ncbi:MAG: hypothetical protein A3K90_06695 [Pelodictyon luteolum]|jgi:glycosyl transferase family 25|uniref:Glycosyl transferase family 25 domain-containing protein n=2 Tax=Pelodictyon luteolum TaxID=1100 RepID=A0A165LV79_PELLU|nr:MAG: hypothetical protein A3K90_06695 [Pelodictyon luteolum]
MAMNFPDHFDRISVINLPDRTDRKRDTLREFRRAGWNPNDKMISFFPAIRPETAGGFPSVGVRGCYTSHMEVLRQAKENKCANILVLEDDISFIREINQIGNAVMEQLEGKKWGFIYFGHDRPAGDKNSLGIELLKEPLMLAHFYAVNGPYLERFLHFLEQLLKRPAGHPDGGPMHYDGAISTFRMQNPDIPTYILYPSLGSQRSSRTDLHALPIWDRWPLLAPLTDGVRQLKNALKRRLP